MEWRERRFLSSINTNKWGKGPALLSASTRAVGAFSSLRGVEGGAKPESRWSVGRGARVASKAALPWFACALPDPGRARCCFRTRQRATMSPARGAEVLPSTPTAVRSWQPTRNKELFKHTHTPLYRHWLSSASRFLFPSPRIQETAKAADGGGEKDPPNGNVASVARPGSRTSRTGMLQ